MLSLLYGTFQMTTGPQSIKTLGHHSTSINTVWEPVWTLNTAGLQAVANECTHSNISPLRRHVLNLDGIQRPYWSAELMHLHSKVSQRPARI